MSEPTTARDKSPAAWESGQWFLHSDHSVWELQWVDEAGYHLVCVAHDRPALTGTTKVLDQIPARDGARLETRTSAPDGPVIAVLVAFDGQSVSRIYGSGEHDRPGA
jgi:hypothetical protein